MGPDAQLGGEVAMVVVGDTLAGDGLNAYHQS